MLNNIDKNEIARKKYLEKWSLNATQHLEEGEYEWICSFIKEYVCILEIGCGTGDSTRVFATLGHKLLSIDNSDTAIKKAEGILEEYDFDFEKVVSPIDFSDNDVLLWNADIVEHKDIIIESIKRLEIDLVLLCNPGGNPNAFLSENECKILMKYGFSEEYIRSQLKKNKTALDYFHKTAIIYASIDVSIECDKPFLLIDRGSIEDVDEGFDEITRFSGLRLIEYEYREIKEPPKEGIKLINIESKKEENYYWKLGLFIT